MLSRGLTPAVDPGKWPRGRMCRALPAGEHVVLPSPRVPASPMEATDPILDPLVHLAYVAAGRCDGRLESLGQFKLRGVGEPKD